GGVDHNVVRRHDIHVIGGRLRWTDNECGRRPETRTAFVGEPGPYGLARSQILIDSQVSLVARHRGRIVVNEIAGDVIRANSIWQVEQILQRVLRYARKLGERNLVVRKWRAVRWIRDHGFVKRQIATAQRERWDVLSHQGLPRQAQSFVAAEEERFVP